MKSGSFSHVGITVSDFNRAVKFWWEIFGCPLVGVTEAPADRVRGFFGVDRLYFTFNGSGFSTGCRTKTSGNNAEKMPVHGAAHDITQDSAAAADQCAGNNQQIVA